MRDLVRVRLEALAAAARGLDEVAGELRSQAFSPLPASDDVVEAIEAGAVPWSVDEWSRRAALELAGEN